MVVGKNILCNQYIFYRIISSSGYVTTLPNYCLLYNCFILADWFYSTKIISFLSPIVLGGPDSFRFFCLYSLKSFLTLEYITEVLNHWIFNVLITSAYPSILFNTSSKKTIHSSSSSFESDSKQTQTTNFLQQQN